jgi:chromosome segregation ATPase
MVTYESEYAALEQKYRAQVKLIAAFEQRVKALEAELSKFIQAVGLASTLVPNMIIDVSDPIGMMQTVTNELSTLSAELHRARTDSRYWDEFNTISKHDAIRAENEQLRAEIKSRVAERVAKFRAEVEGEMDALKAENERLREALKEIDNIQFDLPAKTQIYDKMKAIAKRALGGGA